MGLFDFLFSSHNRGYCDHDEYEGIENDDCYDDNCGWQLPSSSGLSKQNIEKVLLI